MSDGKCGVGTDSGEPCRRDAGWGTPRDHGPCRDHEDDYHNPKKLDEGTANAIVGAAEVGAFKVHCAQAAGITEQTLRNWLNWGEEDAEAGVDTPCAALFLEWQRARGAGAIRRLENADDEFVLERSYDYVKTEKREHEHAGEGGGPIQIEMSETVVETPHSEGSE